MTTPIRFVVFGNDELLLSMYVGKDKQEVNPHLSEFVLYSSLDVVDEMKKSTNSDYLRVIDKSNGYLVSAFVTPGPNEERIRQFFVDVHQLYNRCIMNPFFSYLNPFNCQEFENRIRLLASKL